MDGLVNASVSQTIAFRCDASKEIGSGHVMRCLTLAGTLAARGDKIIFLCTDETLNIVSLLANSPYDKRPLTEEVGADWLVIDHYGLNHIYETRSRSWAKNILVIDDLADRQHDCDILIDMTYGRSPGDYKSLVPPSCEILTGADYALLRPEFMKARQNLHRHFDDARHVLISFGGVNPKGATEMTLLMLEGYQDRPLRIDIMTGSGAAGLDKIQAAAAQINAGNLHEVSLHVDTARASDLMARADICIGAGGTTSWERCCLGLPTLAIELADNQAPTLKALEDFGALISLGKIENLNPGTFLKSFASVMSSFTTLQSLSQKALLVCDGRGADRVACVMLPPEIAKDGKSSTLRYATAADVRNVFEWQSAPGARQHARNPQAPTWNEHAAWFAASLHNPDRAMFIVLHDGKKAGIVRLDREAGEGVDTHEVSILISPDFQGKGLGFTALKLLRSCKAFAIFRAEILPDNHISHKIFDKAGYHPINNGWYISNPGKQE